MINIILKGRIGNWLHEYCYGRLLADELNYNLYCTRVGKHYSTKYWNDSWKIIAEYFPNIYQIKDRQNANGKLVRIKNFINPDNFLINKRLIDKKLLLKSPYCFAEYNSFTPDQQKKIKEIAKCKQCFNLNDLTSCSFKMKTGDSFEDIKIKNITESDIVINVRLCDFLRFPSRYLPFEYFDQILSSGIKYDRVFIISDDINSELLHPFKKYNAIYYVKDGSYIQDLNMIRLFNKIVISQSSFSWWAALLSNAKEVYSPLSNHPKSPWRGRYKTLLLPEWIGVKWNAI